MKECNQTGNEGFVVKSTNVTHAALSKAFVSWNYTPKTKLHISVSYVFRYTETDRRGKQVTLVLGHLLFTIWELIKFVSGRNLEMRGELRERNN